MLARLLRLATLLGRGVVVMHWAVGSLGCDRARASDEAEKPSPDDQRALSDFVARLTRIQAYARAHVEEKPCPESPSGKEIFGAALVADVEFLRMLSSGATAPSAPTDPWRALTSPGLFELELGRPKSADAARETRYRIVQLEQHYAHLGVAVATQRTTPELHGDQFVTGHFDGWLSVFDLRTAAPVCATRWSASNSEQVAGRVDQNRSDAIRRDFAMNLGRELDRAATRLSAALVLDH
jgi:hypothetical protein